MAFPDRGRAPVLNVPLSRILPNRREAPVVTPREVERLGTSRPSAPRLLLLWVRAHGKKGGADLDSIEVKVKLG